jgi:hypothetical protein
VVAAVALAAAVPASVSRSSIAATSPPANSALPTISGTVVVGQTLSSTTGSWTNLPTSYAYQWLQCSSTGGSCVSISSATASTYTLQRADLGKTIRVSVVASNDAGASPAATSAQTAKVAGIAPQNTAPPTFSPMTGLSSGSTVTETSNGTWSATPTVSSYAYQWQSCTSPTDTSTCSDISGATATTYALTDAQLGTAVRLGVRATNVCSSGCGSTWAYSAAGDVAAATSAPVNTTLPAVSGSAVGGQTLTASNGTWSNSPTGYAYQWSRCDSTGGSCASISGATAAAYTLVSADVGKTLRVTVTASNAAGSGSATSTQTGKVSGTLPQNTSAPTFTPTTGLAVDTTVSLVSKGTWTGIPTPTKWTYQWQSCTDPGSPASCANIAGATATSYTVASTDAGKYIRLGVSGGNTCSVGCGTTVAYSAESGGAVASGAPANTSAPTILGTAQTGQVLTATTGNWTNSPSSYAYQWQLCDSGGAGCAAISGQATSSYTIQQTDAGHAIRVQVTAANSFGSAGAVSAPTAPVATGPPPPVNTTAPTIGGTPTEAQTLQVSPGTWSGSGITFTYQWRRCTQAASPCVDVAGATGTSYVLGRDDVSGRIVVTVTATNTGGTATASTQATAVVAALPQATGDPVVAAVGDIACDPSNTHFNGGLGTTNDCHEMATSNVALGRSLSAVLLLGDNQYGCGGLQAFLQSYDPSWGRLKSITHPAIGNHEYYTSSPEGSTDCDLTGSAKGYFTYFGAAAGDPSLGYYSWDLAGWHFVVLNTNCSKSHGCYAGSQQEKWLKADLAAHPAACTVAYWHHPRFSSVSSSTASSTYYSDLVAAHAEIILSGHVHNYERFAPQTSTGTYDPSGGIREFVVGSGGESLQPFPTTKLATSELQLKRYGVLLLTLHASSYDWAFVSDTGTTLDSGTAYCH